MQEPTNPECTPPRRVIATLIGVVLAVFVATVGWFGVLREIHEIAQAPALATASVVKVDHESLRSFAYVYNVGARSCRGRGYLYRGEHVRVGQQVEIQYATQNVCVSTNHPHSDPGKYFRDYAAILAVVSVVFGALVGLATAAASTWSHEP